MIGTIDPIELAQLGANVVIVAIFVTYLTHRDHIFAGQLDKLSAAIREWGGRR